jgi:hypothetical protein
MPDLAKCVRALTLAVALAATAGTGIAQAQCPLSERESREALSSGRVDRLPSVLRRAGLSMGEVVSADLCSSGGGYVYRVKLLAPGGRLREITLPAG